MSLLANALQRALPDFVLPAAHFTAHALAPFRRPLFARAYDGPTVSQGGYWCPRNERQSFVSLPPCQRYERVYCHPYDTY